MLITFVNNEGGGGVRDLDAPDGQLVGDFIRNHMPNYNSERHQIRVNRESASPADILEEGDHIAVMPTKVGGGEMMRL